MATYNWEGIPTSVALLKSPRKAELMRGSSPMLSMICWYKPGMFLHTVNKSRYAVLLYVKYPNATAAPFLTCKIVQLIIKVHVYKYVTVINCLTLCYQINNYLTLCHQLPFFKLEGLLNQVKGISFTNLCRCYLGKIIWVNNWENTLENYCLRQALSLTVNRQQALSLTVYSQQGLSLTVNKQQALSLTVNSQQTLSLTVNSQQALSLTVNIQQALIL